MPADHPPKYWQAVANVLEGESAKAEVYVNHSLSLGVAREAILRNIVMDETPGPFSVKTGIIRESSSGDLVSRQCDLLIFDPNVDTPFYKMDEFVVIPSACARVVIECKSKIDSNAMPTVIDIWQSTRPMSISTLVFGFDGVKFNTFTKSCVDLMDGDTVNLPPCICNHKQNYLAIRASEMAPGVGRTYHVLDFDKFENENKGCMATAYFLQWYSWILRNRTVDAKQVNDWFNRLNLPDEAKIVIHSDGTVTVSYTHLTLPTKA